MSYIKMCKTLKGEILGSLVKIGINTPGINISYNQTKAK